MSLTGFFVLSKILGGTKKYLLRGEGTTAPDGSSAIAVDEATKQEIVAQFMEG